MRLDTHCRPRRTRRPATLALALTLLSLLPGCGERGEQQHLEQAKVVASNDRHELTIEKAQEVLAKEPGNAQAMRLKASAELALARYGQARNTLLAAVEAQPADLALRQELVQWAVAYATATLDKSGFLDNTELQGEFDRTLDTGRQQVEQIRSLSPATQDWRVAAARLIGVDLARGEKALAKLRSSPELLSDQAGDRGKAERDVADRAVRNDALRDQMDDLLRAVLDAQPDHAEALQRYARLLTEREHWIALWALAERAAARPRLAADTAAPIATGLLLTPDTEQPLERRTALARKLIDLVPADEQQSFVCLLVKAQMHHAAGEWLQALPIIERMRQDNLQDPQAKFLLAQNAFGRGEYQTAVTVCEQLLTQYASAPTQVIYARSLARTGRAELGIAELRKTVETDPNNLTARQALVTMLAEAGFLAEASDDIAEFYRREPTHPAAIQLAMQYYQAMGKRDDAQRVLRELQAIKAPTLDHLRLLVEGCTDFQQYDQALRYARELAARRPDLLVEQMRLLGALLVAGNMDEATRQAQDIRAKNAGTPGVDAGVARLYLRHRPDAAAPLIDEALAKDPGNTDLQLMAAQALAARGAASEAMDRVAAVLARDPGNTSANVLGWRLSQLQGDADAAAMHLAQIDPTQLDPRSGAAVIAQVRLSEGRADEAIAVCNTALLGGNNDPMLRMMLAQLYQRQGNQQMVEAHLAGLVGTEPNSPTSWQMLCRYYIASRDINRGMDVLSSLQSANPVLASLSKAQLLISGQQYETAAVLLEPVFNDAVRRRDASTLMIADALALAHQRSRAREAAAAVYTQMISASLDVPRATLRRIDINHSASDPQPTIDALVALAKTLPDGQTPLRVEVVRRLTSLGQHDVALSLLEQRVAGQQDASDLLAVRGQVLMDARRPEEAIASFRRAIELSPKEVEYRLRLGWALQQLADEPGAEAVFQEIATLGPRAKIAAVRQLVTHYARLGLLKPSLAAFEELEGLEPYPDPALLLLSARNFKTIGNLDRAVATFERIARRSSAYGAAQVEIARIELERARQDQARQRVTTATNDPDTAASAAAALLSFDMGDPLTQIMLGWCEGYLEPRRLPAELEVAWHKSRVMATSESDNLAAMVESLTRLAALQPQAHEHVAARVALHLSKDRIEDAQITFDGSGEFKSTPRGQLLAIVLARLPPAQPALTKGMHGVLEAILRQDLAAARNAAQTLETLRTIYRSDMLAVLADDRVVDGQHAWYWRELTVAAVALESGLPRVTETVALKLAQSATAPEAVLVCGLYAQALLSQGKPTEPAAALIEQRRPDSVLAHYLAARKAASTGDHAGVIAHCDAALRLEPGHIHLKTMLASALREAREFGRATELLDGLVASDNPVRISATVELIEMLTGIGGESLKHAAQVATEAMQRPGATPNLVATIGWLEHLAGQDPAAQKHLSRAVAALPNRPILHYRLGVVYLGLGLTRWSRFHLEQAAAGPATSPFTSDAQALLVRMPSR